MTSLDGFVTPVNFTVEVYIKAKVKFDPKEKV